MIEVEIAACHLFTFLYKTSNTQNPSRLFLWLSSFSLIFPLICRMRLCCYPLNTLIDFSWSDNYFNVNINVSIKIFHHFIGNAQMYLHCTDILCSHSRRHRLSKLNYRLLFLFTLTLFNFLITANDAVIGTRHNRVVAEFTSATAINNLVVVPEANKVGKISSFVIKYWE